MSPKTAVTRRSKARQRRGSLRESRVGGERRELLGRRLIPRHRQGCPALLLVTHRGKDELWRGIERRPVTRGVVSTLVPRGRGYFPGVADAAEPAAELTDDDAFVARRRAGRRRRDERAERRLHVGIAAVAHGLPPAEAEEGMRQSIAVGPGIHLRLPVHGEKSLLVHS